VEILHHQNRIQLNDSIFPDESDIVACQRCGFVYVDSDLSQEKLNDYYNNFSVYECVASTVSSTIPNDFERERFDYSKNIILKYCKKDDTILDIGCAGGAFLQILQENGFSNLYGMDLSVKNLNNVKTKEINPIHETITNRNFCAQKEKQKFSMITMFHVLEHIYDLDLALSNISSLLKPNGFLLIEVPNAAKYDEIGGITYFMEEHINHFDENSLVNTGKKHGFQLINANGERIVEKKMGKELPVINVCFQFVNTTQNQSNTKYSALCKEKIQKYVMIRDLYLIPIKNLIDKLTSSQEHIAIWGAGWAFGELLTTTLLKNCYIDHIVDMDIHKQGRTIIGHRVSHPDILKDYQGSIFITASYYPQSVLKNISDMGLKNKVYVILGNTTN
jgi:2-polyprenyl-3-methyl-5-hydroxy-6-metoxy-1,4-benzoquinol methylase